ncbi:unnamed protein product [Rodentolepis nana]|uniref:AA_TRNA_LIGASE_II domain-containing protein n=1 Tax=Rodentolepis nana TaxID=102285 RepID=A0A158QHI0_RODNA|nr:unnamed protein product [Rodentolepis nana]
MFARTAVFAECVVCSTPDIPNGLSVGSAVSIGGEIVLRPINGEEFATELRADHIDLLSPPEVDKKEENDVIIGALSRSRPRLGLLRSEKGLYWRHRLPEMAAMLRLRAACKSIVHRAMQDRGYLESPKNLVDLMFQPTRGSVAMATNTLWMGATPATLFFESFPIRVRTVFLPASDEFELNELVKKVDTPILTTADCEGSGETFLVTPTASSLKEGEETLQSSDGCVDREGQRQTPSLHLTVSAQLHLEALAIGMNKVYTLSPTFRAEPSHSRFHLAEFLMLEGESVAMTTTEALCDEVEAIVRKITTMYLESISSSSSGSSTPQKDLALVLSYLAESLDSMNVTTHLSSLDSILSRPFTRMTFHEALATLNRLGKRTLASETNGFSKEEEQALCLSAGNSAVFVTDFPLSQKPFYCSRSPANAMTSAAVDLLIPEVGEMVGGSVREDNRERLLERMPGGEVGTLNWYADLRGHGGAPHGGFGLGFDRMLLWLLGVYNIRDTVTFPREIGKMYL